MVALARTPGPKRFPPPCRPIASRTGPLTITMSAAPPVLVAGPWSVNAGSPMARSAAPTTGKYSGRRRAAPRAGAGPRGHRVARGDQYGHGRLPAGHDRI